MSDHRSELQRRAFLKILLGGAAASAAATWPLMRALADGGSPTSNEYFIIIHQSGGWDVTLWGDPRNERTGLIEPASTDNVTTAGITGWTDQALDADTQTFRILQRGGLPYGPAMGSLVDLTDRFMVVNGIAMNTVSHPDGTYFSSTGRHLAGGRPVAASIDTMLANEFGTADLLPIISVNFPSTFVGQNLDARVVPLRVSDVTAVSKSLSRTTLYDQTDDRSQVTALLAAESEDWARDAYDPTVPRGIGQQFGALGKMLSDDVRALFDPTKLRAAHPAFNYAGKYQTGAALNASFAIEAIRRRLLRCVSFATSSCDTHNTNYRFHPLILQETFEVIASLLREMDATTFNDSTERLSDHVHILVVSEFCRTPQVNLAGGRDHYPNNSALIASPRFRTNFRYGSSDPGQLLPKPSGSFADGARAITPADILATFLGALQIDPRKYMRDGEVVRELLK